jgi:hypothetical protein
MAFDRDNPLHFKLDEHGVMTDINELRELVHGFAKQAASMLMSIPGLALVLGPEYEQMVAGAVAIHNFTCPEPAGKKHWIEDYDERIVTFERELAEYDRQQKPLPEEAIEVPASLVASIREALGE